jgi:cobalamin-dependent methionine synthase I
MKRKTITNLDFASTSSLKTKGAPNIALADFIAQRQVTDYMGFCVTTGFGVDEWALNSKRFR